MDNKPAAGHLAAALTVFIWGTTFISTKVLLRDFQPVEILFFRFVMGFIALFIVCPRNTQSGTDLYRRGIMWSMSLLFAGKYCSDIYHGVQCGGHLLRGSVFYCGFISSVLKTDREAFR